MSAILQLISLTGKTIDAARWEIPSITNLREGNNLQLSFPSSDIQLIAYINRTGVSECSVDREKDKYSIVLNCHVKQIRHLYDTENSALTSMATLMPMNRVVENILIYLIDPGKSDQRFLRLIQSGFLS